MTRKPINPVRIGRTWVLASGRLLPVISGGDETAGDETADPVEPVEIPESLEDREQVPDEMLLGFEQALVAEFDRLVESGSRDLSRLNELAGEIERVRGEQGRRTEEDSAITAQIAELAAQVNPAAESEGDADPGEGDADPDPADADPDAVTDPAAEPVTVAPDPAAAVTAAAPSRKRVTVPPASAVRGQAPAPSPTPESNQGLVSITAAADVPGFGVGAAVQYADLPAAMHGRAKNLSDHSGRVPVAKISRGLTMVSGPGFVDVTDALDAQIASMGNAAALVAAGGWCRTIQQFLDLFAIEGTDAMFDLPTIGVDGAGVAVPSFIGFDAADQALWTWTAANDETGTLTVSDLDIATGTATATTSTNHNLATGQWVRISDASTPAANGTYEVTVTGATTFTFASGLTVTNGTAKATGIKPMMRIPCPTWTEYELQADGLAIEHGNLTNRAWPGLGARYVNLAMAAHERRMRAQHLTAVIATAGAAEVLTDVGSDAAGEMLAAIEFAATRFRETYGMPQSAVVEQVFPVWAPAQVRASIARRAGIDPLGVTTAQIIGEFTARNVRPQFVRDYQPLGPSAVAYPATMNFLTFASGSYFVGSGGEIDLGVQRDSSQNERNDFTLAWSEEFNLVGQRGPDADLFTVATAVDGKTGGNGA